MPALKVPASGLSFDSVSGKSTKSASSTQDIIGLTLTDGMIEEMIKCVQNGKPIQLSLGQHPNLSFGNTTQQLSSYQDPFKHEVYQSTNSTDKMPAIQPSGRPSLFFQRLLNSGRKPEKQSATSAAAVKSVTAAVDSARETLERSLAEEKARKEGNTTKLINATLDPKRGGALKGTNRSKFLATQSRLHDTSRSMPSSPALSGIGSPMIAPTSVPASQLIAEKAKAVRKPIIHLLALGPMSESSLRAKVLDLTDNDFETALNQVADKDNSTQLFTLIKKYYKELDVWEFDYESEKDRQAVIENTIKVYDRLRIPSNDGEWERLKSVEKRGDGVTLSRVQARIAQGPIPRTPKINMPNADSGRDTPGQDGEEAGNKAISRVKKDAKPRSSSQPPTAKAKRVSEKEAQSKRILATKKKPAPAPRKEVPVKVGSAKPLSNVYVNSDSDEEDTTVTQKGVSAKPAPPPKATKRAREEETTSDSSLPLSRKVRASEGEVERKNKPAPAPQPKRGRDEESTSDSSLPLSKKARPSDASQSSFASSSLTGKTTKGTSLQKSSPLASSPPTNASEFGSSSSASSTPRHHPSTRGKSTNIHVHKRNTSSASSATSNGSGLSTHILDLARKYRTYHNVYSNLHHELSAVAERERDVVKWQELMDMHERLVEMKREIYEATDGL